MSKFAKAIDCRPGQYADRPHPDRLPDKQRETNDLSKLARQCDELSKFARQFDELRAPESTLHSSETPRKVPTNPHMRSHRHRR